eukprot:4992814-Pleurochrysis_carterae.AAC.1
MSLRLIISRHIPSHLTTSHHIPSHLVTSRHISLMRRRVGGTAVDLYAGLCGIMRKRAELCGIMRNHAEALETRS